MPDESVKTINESIAMRAGALMDIMLLMIISAR